MNFSINPKRSTSEDELEQTLNAWARNEPSDSASDATADALEFHRWADETRRTDPAAKGPAAGTWNRVLHHVEQKSPRGTAAMNASTASAANDAAIVYDSRPFNRKEMSLSKFANIAATVAIVFAVSVGGWFAMSQLPPGSDGRFGAFQASPEVAQSGTCDVEPLTVDEVIAIVENPYSVAPKDTWGTPPPDDPYAPLAGDGLQEHPAQFYMPTNMTDVPDEQEFAAIESAANQYMACSSTGSVGQLMAVTHPEQLQYYVLSNFPVYRDQMSVRAFVEDVIDLPANSVSPAFRELPEAMEPGYQWMYATTERTRIRMAPYPGPSLLVNVVAKVGIDFIDGNGETIGATDWDATVLDGDMESTNGGVSLILVYIEATDSWYYYGYNAPRG